MRKFRLFMAQRVINKALINLYNTLSAVELTEQGKKQVTDSLNQLIELVNGKRE